MTSTSGTRLAFVTTTDGTRIAYKDWGEGPPVVLSHGWPLNPDSWEAQMLFLAGHGYRCIAHDRRGHGRSDQPGAGNDMDTYADDLAAVIEALDLRGATLVGFSTGGGEVARYLGRHGSGRVAAAVLVSAVPPFMLRTDDNPGGVPLDVFDGIRAGALQDRSQLYRDLADGPFFGADRPGTIVSQGIRAALIDGAELLVYPGAPHGITDIHKDQLAQDLLAFLDATNERSRHESRPADA